MYQFCVTRVFIKLYVLMGSIFSVNGNNNVKLPSLVISKLFKVLFWPKNKPKIVSKPITICNYHVTQHCASIRLCYHLIDKLKLDHFWFSYLRKIVYFSKVPSLSTVWKNEWFTLTWKTFCEITTVKCK